jgi:hypothetical protein
MPIRASKSLNQTIVLSVGSDKIPEHLFIMDYSKLPDNAIPRARTISAAWHESFCNAGWDEADWPPIADRLSLPDGAPLPAVFRRIAGTSP